MKERTPSTNTAEPGFLAALDAITRHEDFSVKFEVEGEHLRVIVQILGHEPLEALGPPAALDAQLPAAIAKYAAWVESRIAKAEVKIDLPSGAAAIEPVRQKAKPAPRIARPRKKLPAKKAARKAAPKRSAPVRVPAKKQRAAPTTKPGKAECIADYQVLKAKHGDKLTRRLFVDQGSTGRRYEKLWANNWPSFAKEAEGSKASSEKPAGKAAPQASLQLPTGKKTPASASTKGAAKPSTPKAEKPPKDEKRPWTVKAGKKTLGATIFEKKPGDTYTCSSGTYTVKSVDRDKREIDVEPAGTKPAEQPAPKGETATASAAASGSEPEQTAPAEEAQPAATQEIK